MSVYMFVYYYYLLYVCINVCQDFCILLLNSFTSFCMSVYMSVYYYYDNYYYYYVYYYYYYYYYYSYCDVTCLLPRPARPIPAGPGEEAFEARPVLRAPAGH